MLTLFYSDLFWNSFKLKFQTLLMFLWSAFMQYLLAVTCSDWAPTLVGDLQNLHLCPVQFKKGNTGLDTTCHRPLAQVKLITFMWLCSIQMSHSAMAEWHWASMNNTRPLTIKQINGIEPPFILWFTPVFFPTGICQYVLSEDTCAQTVPDLTKVTINYFCEWGGRNMRITS